MQRAEVSGPSTPYVLIFFESDNLNSQQAVALGSGRKGCNITSPSSDKTHIQTSVAGSVVDCCFKTERRQSLKAYANVGNTVNGRPTANERSKFELR